MYSSSRENSAEYLSNPDVENGNVKWSALSAAG